MANAVVEAFLGITGLTLTCDLYPLGSDVIAASAIPLTEETSRKGLYLGTTTAALTGVHQAFLKSGATLQGLGYVKMSDDTSIHRIVDAANVSVESGTKGAATIAAGDDVDGVAIKAKTDNLPSDPADQSLIIAATDAVMTRLGAPVGASVSADVAAVKTDTTTLLSRITSTLFSGITSLAEWLGLMSGKQVGNATARTELRATGAGSGTFDETTDSEEAIRDRGDVAWITGGATLTGANLVTITVREGATPIEGAKVRVTWAAQTEIKNTNVSGIVTFQLDNATWNVGITKAGFVGFSTTLEVDGVETPSPYLITRIAATPSDPGYVTGFGIYEFGGVVQNAMTITVRQTEAYGNGLVSDRSQRTTTTNSSGYWEFTGLIPGATYMFAAGPELREEFERTIPTSATDPYEIPSFLGT